MAATPMQPSSAGAVPWPADLAARYVAKGYWDGRSIAAHIYQAADRDPDAICLVDGVRLTFRQLTELADGAAVRLRELGLRAGDPVVLQLPNCWQFVVLTVACLRLGVVPAMALTAHRRQEIAGVAALTDAKALFVPGDDPDFDHQAMAADLLRGAPSLEHVLVLGGAIRGGAVDIAGLCAPPEHPARTRAELDAVEPDGAAIALFLLSGGTTGVPKVIARTHNDYGYMARQAARICRVGRDAAYLAVLPLGHGFPMSGPGVLGTLMAGGRAVIARSPAPQRAFGLIERERVTITSVVPAIVQRWLDHRAATPEADLSSLRVVQVGASKLTEQQARRVGSELGCALQQVYGMSEGLLCLTRLDDPEDAVLGTQGRPVCPDDELLIVDEQGRPVAEGEPGVLLTRGPYTPRGYYRAPELNARAFVDGWYRTGDIVRRRPDGNVVIEGRDKDVINRGGEKIPAEEVEDGAYLLDGVRQAAAVAMPDPELGERICLYVVPHEGGSVSLDEVREAMLRAGAARFKLPERLVLVDDLPRTPIGKIDKKVLRADIADRLLARPAYSPRRPDSPQPRRFTVTAQPTPDHTQLSQHELMALPQGDLRLLQTDLAQRLLVSRELARLAYVAKDGTPRVLPVMFHWNGTEVIICSFAEAAKLPALRARPDVAITIDTSSHPPEILLIRGRAELTDVDGVAEEFKLANYRYGGPEFGAGRIAEVDHPGTRMVRIAIRPTWVGLLDFKIRFSGGRNAGDFLQRGRQQRKAS